VKLKGASRKLFGKLVQTAEDQLQELKRNCETCKYTSKIRRSKKNHFEDRVRLSMQHLIFIFECKRRKFISCGSLSVRNSPRKRQHTRFRYLKTTTSKRAYLEALNWNT